MYELKLPYYISYFLAKVWLAVKKKFLSIRNVLIQISNLSIAYKKIHYLEVDCMLYYS